MKQFSFIQKIRNKIKIDFSSTIALGNNIKIVGTSVTIKGKNNSLVIEDNSVIRNSVIEIIGNDCTISIGKNCMIGDNCYLVTKEEGVKLCIGNNCGLSRNIKIMTSDGHPIYQNDVRINRAADVILQDDIWVADNATILKGVTIEKGSVVGINAVVTKSAPANSILAGNPAKVVKEDITWKDKEI